MNSLSSSPTWSRRFDLGDRGRDWIKATTAQMALDSLRRWLLGTLTS